MSTESYQYFNHPSWRRVISQLREIFNDLHEHVEGRRGETNTNDKFKSEQTLSLSDLCLDSSQKYITIIENELKLVGEANEDDLTVKESFQLILKVWKLCQIIFIKSSPSGTLLLDLQDWYRSTNNIDPMIQEIFSAYSNHVENLSQNENYWPLLLISVAQSRIDTARHLLSFHPKKNLSVFRAVDEQLRTMPNFATLGHLSLFEFRTKWEIWQKKCVQVLTNENFGEEETGTLEIVCKMLCADESTFLDLKPIYNNWYYMLISYMSYSNPTFNISDIHLTSGNFMKKFENEFIELDAIIHNIIDFDVGSVIKQSVELFANNLFSAHLLDILFLSGKLQLSKYELAASSSNSFEMVSYSTGASLRPDDSMIHQQHLIEYATQILSACSLSSSLSMYETAFDYLIKCKQENKGIELIEGYMEKIPLTTMSETNAYKLFHMAYELDLHDLAFSIGRIMQMRAFTKGMYGISLGWNVRIKDASFGTMLAERILEDFFKTNDLSLLELTENLSRDILYCDRLIFLSKYKEFYILTRQSQQDGRLDSLRKAGTLLIQLLEAPKLVPYKYQRIVLYDLYQMIGEKSLFEESQLFSMLRIIQNYENRRDVFREGHRFNRHLQHAEIEMEEQPEPARLNLDDKFDNLKWKEFLSEIGNRVAESFVSSDADF